MALLNWSKNAKQTRLSFPGRQATKAQQLQNLVNGNFSKIGACDQCSLLETKYFDYCSMFQESKLGVKLERTGKQLGHRTGTITPSRRRSSEDWDQVWSIGEEVGHPGLRVGGRVTRAGSHSSVLINKLQLNTF